MTVEQKSWELAPLLVVCFFDVQHCSAAGAVCHDADFSKFFVEYVRLSSAAVCS